MTRTLAPTPPAVADGPTRTRRPPLGPLAVPDDPADGPTRPTLLVYAARVIVGLLLATVGARLLALRPAAARVRP
ncbi:hypothetical protein [Streptomyces sp. JHA26]|uniref:hypothetical protein n=1 Tax=Streptomyces sp. JHA26 TaxID=1917143 RepID=UPI00098B54A9|nr:hypothetical protein [Streptomyces sp. JHA26]